MPSCSNLKSLALPAFCAAGIYYGLSSKWVRWTVTPLSANTRSGIALAAFVISHFALKHYLTKWYRRDEQQGDRKWPSDTNWLIPEDRKRPRDTNRLSLRDRKCSRDIGWPFPVSRKCLGNIGWLLPNDTTGVIFDFLDGASQRRFLLAMGNNIDYGDAYMPMQWSYVGRINQLILAFSNGGSKVTVTVSPWEANPDIPPINLLFLLEEKLSQILINASFPPSTKAYPFNPERIAALDGAASLALEVLAKRSSGEFDKMNQIVRKISLLGFKKSKLTLSSLVSVVTLQLWDKDLYELFEGDRKLRREMMRQHKVPRGVIAGFIKTSQKTFFDDLFLLMFKGKDLPADGRKAQNSLGMFFTSEQNPPIPPILTKEHLPYLDLIVCYSPFDIIKRSVSRAPHYWLSTLLSIFKDHIEKMLITAAYEIAIECLNQLDSACELSLEASEVLKHPSFSKKVMKNNLDLPLDTENPTAAYYLIEGLLSLHSDIPKPNMIQFFGVLRTHGLLEGLLTNNPAAYRRLLLPVLKENHDLYEEHRGKELLEDPDIAGELTQSLGQDVVVPDLQKAGHMEDAVYRSTFMRWVPGILIDHPELVPIKHELPVELELSSDSEG